MITIKHRYTNKTTPVKLKLVNYLVRCLVN